MDQLIDRSEIGKIIIYQNGPKQLQRTWVTDLLSVRNSIFTSKKQENILIITIQNYIFSLESPS